MIINYTIIIYSFTYFIADCILSPNNIARLQTFKMEIGICIFEHKICVSIKIVCSGVS